MAANQQDNTQPASTWTEPPWSGWIETTGDALLILEAARRGFIPRVTRRLVDSERKMITSGSVFVFDEDESGIKRWTDGFFWSPSRILGNFLLYRETDKRGAGHRGARSDPPSDANDQTQYNVDGAKSEGQSLSRPKGEKSQLGIDRYRERTLVGSLTNSYKFKPDGLMKKTFSLTIGGVSQHLISYYRVEDVEGGRLRSPSSIPELAALDISPEYLDKTHFRNPPKVEIGADGLPRYRGEADDIDTSPTLLPAPLSSGLPLLNDPRAGESSSSSKRTKRYDPYGTTPKRTRKAKGASTQSSATDQQSQSTTSPQQHPHVYPESNVAVIHPPYPPYGLPSYYQMPGYALPPPHPHLYPTGPYPGAHIATAGPLTSPTQQGVATIAQGPPIPYHGYPGPSTIVDTSLPGQQPGQQAYYPYYPPPHGHYPGYGGVAWPHYTGYPPQPIIHQPVIATTATVTEVENKESTSMESAELGTESDQNEDV